MNEQPSTPTLATATLAGGCFWCLEAVYDELEGVIEVESGYAGGKIANPTYKQVCTGSTGHAEVVQITFDPERHLLPGAAGGLLRDPRPDDPEPAGERRGHAIPLGHLLPHAGAEADRRAGHRRAERCEGLAQPHRDRGGAPHCLLPRQRLTTRSITSTTAPSPIARSSSRPSWRSSGRSTSTG